ncbi:MAG TPA: response regulator [Pyrinomonadaceae bacterium]|nr:response regulator [Pyrinomonadaceae bacterium]
MDPKLFPAFIDEAMGLLPETRGALLVYSQSGSTDVDLEIYAAKMRSLSEAAGMLGLTEIFEITQAVVAEISFLTLTPNDIVKDVHPALDFLAKLEATLLKVNLDDENFSLNIDDFVNESFDLLQVNERVVSMPLPADPICFDGPSLDMDEFEVDQELREIFAEEAEGLLRNMESSLEKLAQDQHDSDSLWEIRRNAHTFKGSAGIVGLKQLSELAHRVEDLLDRLAETKNSSNERIFVLLRTATGCLKALTTGESSPQLFQQISQLYYDFDNVLAALSETPESVPVEMAQPSFAVVETFETALPVMLEQPAMPPTEKVFAVVAEDKSQEKAPQSRSIVRVSLSRLDELVGIVRDMIISRSVFEQRFKDLDRQIDELHNTTRRLQTTSTKLEIDFEASMMSSDRPSAFGPVTPMSRQYGFDDLEFDQYTEFHQSTRELAETTSDTFAINTALDSLRGNFEILFDEQRRLVEELQEKLMRIRMVEFGSLSNRLQRAVRVTCEEENKKAQISIINEKLEIDTQILDSMIEPLMHLLKNAVVHGIESPEVRRLLGKPELGLIEVSMTNEETHIVLTVSDDGRGIGPTALKDKAVAMGLITHEAVSELSEEETLELIFLPGLTTAERLNLSAGRGVGMSIVKESIEASKGTISIDSTPQKGTRFTVRMPLALAVTNVLLVKVDRQTYALPLKQIRHVSEINAENFSRNAKGDEISIAGTTHPLICLGSYVNAGSQPSEDLTGMNALLVASTDRTYALSVNDVLRSEEVVIKSLGKPLDNLKGVLGAAILGNGELVPILDLPTLIKKKPKREKIDAPAPVAEKLTIMIVDDSPSVRHLTSKIIEGAGWEVKTAKDGIDALEQLKAAAKLPAVILSDIEMPRMDGYELAASLQRSDQFNKIPVVMITSRSADKHREKALENGVSQYLTKPYDDKELIRTIKTLANII